MNEQLIRTLLKRYEAEIEDAIFKIDCICDHNMVIPEHVDITGELDKQIERVAAAEDKVAALRKHYVENKAKDEIIPNKAIL
tara:strand:+ start:51 stop:296 length:246 start_codon:yes stop_codon:yes gene_type:complete